MGARGSLGLAARPQVFILFVVWAILPAMMRFAGAVFASTQDLGSGDMLTRAGAAPNHFASVLFSSAAMVIAAVVIFPAFRAVFSECKRHFWITATCVLALVSMIWTQDALMTLKASTFLWLSTLFVYWIKVRFSVEQQMQLMEFVGTVLGIVSLFVIVFFPAIGLDKLHENAWQGIFTSKNHMGRIFVFLITPALHYRGRPVFRFAYIAFLASLIMLSQSRSAWIVALLYCLFVALLEVSNRFSRRDVKALCVVVAPMLLTAVWAITENLGSILMFFNRNSTLGGRTTIWKILLLSAEKRPFLGFGYQAFWAGTSSEGMNALLGEYGALRFLASYAHSGYVSVVLEVGIIGLLLIFGLIVRAIGDAMVCLHPNRPSCINWYVGLVFLTVIYNVDEATLLVPAYLPWMMFLLAIMGLSDEAKRVRAARQHA